MPDAIPRNAAAGLSGPAAGYALLSPAMLIIVAMLVAPMLALVTLSFWTQNGFELDTTFTLANYWALIEPADEPTMWMGIPFPFENPVYAILMLKSLVMSLAVTAAVILIAYPMAYFLAFRVTRYKALWIIIITIPFWTSYLGIISEPLSFLLYNPPAVVITLTHAWVTFAVLPIYVSLEKIDRSLLEAATDLGDSKWQRFRRVTLPLSLPGTISAALLVFIPTVGDYVTPTLVGGPGGTMIGNSIQSLFLKQDNSPRGAALSIVMMAIVALLSLLFMWAVGYRKIRARSA